MDHERRLTAQGEERKQQLLDHAAELFAERGYAETRVIDIVEAAGVAKGLFYWYFDNKEALFAEVAENIRLKLRRHQAAAIDPEADTLVRIRQGTEASVEFMADHAHFFSLLEVEGQHIAEILRRGTEQHVDDIAQLIRAGQAAGAIKDEDPRLLAIGVVGAVGYFAHFHRTGRIVLPIDELARFVGRHVVSILAADSEIAATAIVPARQAI